jgi:hypothetical protein
LFKSFILWPIVRWETICFFCFLTDSNILSHQVFAPFYLPFYPYKSSNKIREYNLVYLFGS